jgi:hypothetical protein
MNNPAPALHNRITVVLVLANLCVLTLYVGGWSPATPRTPARQASGRAVLRERPAPAEPVELGDVKIKDKPVKFGDRFEGDDSWLKEVKLKVKNTSKKPITYLRLDLTFPETASTGSVLFHQIFVGRRPDVPTLQGNLPLLLMPNHSTEVSLAAEFDELKKLIELRHSPVGYVNEVNVRLGEVMFEDGTLYSGGAIFKRNPDQSSPRKWVLVKDQGTN